MTLLYYDPRFLEHDTGRHPEQAGRLAAVTAHLTETDLISACTSPAWQPATAARVERIHSPKYVAMVREVVARGGGKLDPDTVVSPASLEVAMLASGAACDAVDRVLAGQDRTALCLIRPPGHHALAEQAMGFCVLNHIAIAAQVAIEEQQLERVLIVDWDVHHGNGTQDAFYTEPRVGFFSAHRWPFYPGTGARSETGAGAGAGTTRNLPIVFGTSRRDYVERFTSELVDFAGQIRPQLVLVSAGFDAHRTDPIGSLGLEAADFDELTRVVLNVADEYAEGRVVSLLEGGYDPAALAECVEAHLRVLLDR